MVNVFVGKSGIQLLTVRQNQICGTLYDLITSSKNEKAGLCLLTPRVNKSCAVQKVLFRETIIYNGTWELSHQSFISNIAVTKLLTQIENSFFYKDKKLCERLKKLCNRYKKRQCCCTIIKHKINSCQTKQPFLVRENVPL